MAGPFAGYSAKIEFSGTATAMTDEACTDLGSDVWQITDSSKRVLDPSDTYTVTDLDGAVAVAEYTIDYLYGKITFSVAPNTWVKITGDYLPLKELTTAKEFSISHDYNILDDTVFHASNTHHKNIVGLKSASGAIGDIDWGDTDLDAGAGEIKMLGLLTNGTQKLLSIKLGSSSIYWRGWVLFEGVDVNSSVDDIVQESISWQSIDRATQDALSSNAAFAFSDL